MSTTKRDYAAEAKAFLIAQDETYCRLVSEIDDLRAELAATTASRNHWQARARHYREQLVWAIAVAGTAVFIALLDIAATTFWR